MSGERVDAIPVTKAELKPVMAETLRVLTQQTGCSGALLAVLGRFLPSEKALAGLRKDDWGPAIREIFAEETHWSASLENHLSQLPVDHVKSPQFQKQLVERDGLKYVRFYGSLIGLMDTCLGEEEIGRALDAGHELSSQSLPPSASETALMLANYIVLADFFKIPGDPQGQLELVKELGPRLYQGWQVK